jgi:uncharacterized SAM-binding protein YcdF (DUF218 family)
MKAPFSGVVLGGLRDLLALYRGGGMRRGPEPGGARAAVILGTQVLPGGRPSRTLDARARHGARLYREGRVDWIIPTGGVGRHPPSEARVMGSVLREEGVPEKVVRLEERALNTWDSARFVAEMVRGEELEGVLIVTDPLHCVRTVAAFGWAGVNAWAEPVYSSPMWRDGWLRRRQLIRESGALVWYGIRHGAGGRFRR